MTELPDLLDALVDYVQADNDVTERVGASGVYGGNLGTGNRTAPNAVVLAYAGGGSLAFPTMEIGDVRVDVFCYGPTPRDAEQTYRNVYPRLKSIERVLQNGVLIHWAKPSAKGRPERDPANDFPIHSSSWQVLAAEVAAT
jgi:hypothetical protein